VSACFFHLSCPYTGAPNPRASEHCREFLHAALAQDVVLVPVCPEQLGGLPTPRPPSELLAPAAEILAGEGRIINHVGIDVTEAFRRGAQEALRLAKFFGTPVALLKSKSPSCGSGQIYSGEFNGRLIDGDGLTAALLKQHGIVICTENAIQNGPGGAFSLAGSHISF
jgi:uncharacterized protein YbbK (DUF523 family)